MISTDPTLYFIALLPPEAIQEEVTGYKQHFAENYQTRQALKSPPHVTLQPPFEWEVQKQGLLEEFLRGFAKVRTLVPMVLSGFGSFPPRVVYINVKKTPELLLFQSELAADLNSSLGIYDPKSKGRSFSPHMTIAFKDLRRHHFNMGWAEFKDRELYYECSASHLTLLVFQDRRWHICGEFPLKASVAEPLGEPN
ncbi:2'-5' RNA ligase family protein [Oscillatoria sp. HE19RPO]|uniref:2'-5' RNA ligase family protein n=1 Tax=Oscillatoria sp. HE19RPO TaxID=2954806 RepID=UPI0020C50369|nr:2'-5' RNA ligase family protein [Oscillatoria sp. HE19RPO]